MKREVQLNQLMDCFQGIIPSMIATHDKDRTPNLSFLSHIEYLDENHIALSNQFFSKTKRNVLETGTGLILLFHPESLQSYELRVKFLRSEMSGELFERISLRLSLIAANEGMSQTFKLLSADVYEVISILPRLGATRLPVKLPPAQEVHGGTNYKFVARGFVDVLNAKEMNENEVIEIILKTIRYGFGLSQSYFYLAADDGSFWKFDDLTMSAERSLELMSEHFNIVSKTAAYGKAIVLSGLQLQRRYLDSLTKEHVEQRSVARQLALPIVRLGKVHGIILIEDDRNGAWESELVDSLRLMCSSVALLIGDKESLKVKHTLLMPGLHFKYHRHSEVLLLNDVPLLKSLPAKILSYILTKKREGKSTPFTNQEIICALQGDFPIEGKANFEARLSLIKKRLESKGLPMRLLSLQRAQFDLVLDEGITYRIEGYPE